MSPIDQEIFKAGMRRLAAGVTIITTTRPDGSRNGLTATDVCSLSAVPPMLLCCVYRETASFPAIVESGAFAVNVLDVADQTLANRFASRISPEERFSEGEWVTLATGAPILTTAVAAFDCRAAQAIEAGTHCIFLGEIVGLHLYSGESQPLLHAQGIYGTFEALKTFA